MNNLSFLMIVILAGGGLSVSCGTTPEKKEKVVRTGANITGSNNHQSLFKTWDGFDDRIRLIKEEGQ